MSLRIKISYFLGRRWASSTIFYDPLCTQEFSIVVCYISSWLKQHLPQMLKQSGNMTHFQIIQHHHHILPKADG